MSDDVVGRRSFPPDPGLVKTLGANHSLPTALADLVDNSLDAGAGRVLIRFLRTGSALQEIHVVDDGRGMDSVGIGHAVTLGARRTYAPRELGHFGVGLKAAALSAANTLRLFSQSYGATPVGLELERATFAKDYSCGELSAEVCEAAEADRAGLLGGRSGTSVRLSDLVATYPGGSAVEAGTWLHTRMHEVRAHLGTVFHRLLADGRLRLEIEEGLLGGARGAPSTIEAIDPFGYAATGKLGYPRVLTTEVAGVRVGLDCHVWPARQSGPEFRLQTPDGRERQGFYVYRGDRLLCVGGWLDGTNQKADLLLARVAVEYEDVAEHLTMNPEKSRIVFDAALSKGVHAAAGDGVDWAGYLETAAAVQTTAKRRQRNRQPSVGLDKGFAPGLRRAIAAELEVHEGYDPMSVKWKRLPEGEFLKVDFAATTVWLNSTYRDLLAGADRRGMNDAPVVKALVFLLTREVFAGHHLGPKDRDNIALWQEVLGGAVRAEAQRWEESE